MKDASQHLGDALKYTLREAAEAAKVHRSTIHRHIKEGRLSAERQDDNTYRIDASELRRVFPSATSQDKTQDTSQDAAHDGRRQPETLSEAPAALEVELMRWRTTAEMLERQLQGEREASREMIEDYRRRLDAAQEAAAVAQATARETVAAFTRQLSPPATGRPQADLTAAPAGTEPPKPSRGLLARLLQRE